MDESNFLLFLESRGIKRILKLYVSTLVSDDDSFHSIDFVNGQARPNAIRHRDYYDNDNDSDNEHESITNANDNTDNQGNLSDGSDLLIESQNLRESRNTSEVTNRTGGVRVLDRGNEVIATAVDDDEDQQNDDSSSLEEHQRIFDFLSFERDNDDADTFYRDRRESFNNGIEYDNEEFSDEESFQGDEIFNRYEYQTRTRNHPSRSEGAASPFNSLSRTAPNVIQPFVSTYLDLEVHDETVKESLQINDGLIDPFNPEYSQIDPSNHYELVKKSPNHKYPNSLKLQFKNTSKLGNHEFVRKYKNNLSTTIKNLVTNCSYLVNASNSEIMVYDFDPITGNPNSNPLVKFDTKPFFTSTSDRLLSTWPYFPHTINYLTTGHWLDQVVLGVCVDDGNIMIHFVDDLIAQIDKFAANHRIQTNDINNISNLFNIKINPDLKIKLESSAWGLDFLQYRDHNNNLMNLLITSDNSQSLTLFIYDMFDERFYHVRSHQVLHNIPNVSFLKHNNDGDKNDVKVSCCSISGELIIFKFLFYTVTGPLNKRHDSDSHGDQDSLFPRRSEGNRAAQRTYYVDSGMEQLEVGTDLDAFDLFKRYLFCQPKVINRVLLREDCWTTIPIDKKYFSHQHSLNLVFGDGILSNKSEVFRIISESSLFNSLHHDDSNLGIATNWQYFETPVLNLNKDSYNQELQPKLTTLADDYRRINKQFNKFQRLPQDKIEQGEMDLEDNDHLIMVSTSKKVGLFNANSLLCHASTANIFNVDIPFNEESKFSNRISISHVIPELSCYIAVTQQGLISIFRLCQHRGVYGFRQEYLFPNAMALSLGPNGHRTIIGLCSREVSALADFPRFLLFVSYSDGLLLTYEISNPANSLMDAYNI